MTLSYHIGDQEFNASNLQDLKRELEEYFSYKGFLPELEILSDYVRVDIDDKKIASAEAKVKLAHDCCNRGNFISAKKLLQEVLEICPLYSDAYRTLAQILMQEGREEEAVEACSEALKCDPKNMWALILMGNLEPHFRKDMEKSWTYYEKALEYYPYNTIALNNIAGAMLGVAGISPDRKGYFLPSVPGREFGGYEMLAWYYASWALSAPEMVDKLNLPFSHAWKQAVSMWEVKKKNGSGN